VRNEKVQVIVTPSTYSVAKPLGLPLLAHNTAQILHRRLGLHDSSGRRESGDRTNSTWLVVLLPMCIVESTSAVEAQRQGFHVDAQKPDGVAVAPDCCRGEDNGW
jgi:hypothetical protein